MAARNTYEAKADAQPSENKAVRPAAANKRAAGKIRVRVIKSHDGIGEGTEFSKPAGVALNMIKLGFWERV